MSEIFFNELGLRKPDHNLAIGSGSHGAQTGAMLVKLEQCIEIENPDYVLVYGDTNSTLAAALSAVKLEVPVAHVEAGLRSFNRKMPEEINRVVTDHLSSLLFAPTELAVTNLLLEGRPIKAIANVGDVMHDVALLFGEHAKLHSNVLEKNDLRENEFVLATFHRAENTNSNERMAWIVAELKSLSKQHRIIIPLHPRTRKLLEQQKLYSELCSAQNLTLISPVGYLDMIRLEQAALVVVTDSGGVQKEAFFHKTPCITLRDETEWKELIASGWNQLCPPRGEYSLVELVNSGVLGQDVVPLYGNGTAGKQIVDILLTQ